MDTDLKQMPMKWFEVWRNVIFHPTIKTFSRIIRAPNVSVRMGVIWMAIACIIAWFVGPQRAILWGWVITFFGYRAEKYFYTIGALSAAILGVLDLLIVAAISQGIASLFDGKGKYKELVYSWALIQLPFILVTGFIMFLPSLFSGSGADTFSRGRGIASIITILLVIGILLYLTYVEMVAFSAAQKFSIGKGIWIFILSLFVLSIVGVILSYGVQALLGQVLRL